MKLVRREELEVPSVFKKNMQHSMTTNGKNVTLNMEFLNQTDCNEMVRFLTEAIDEMTSNEGE